MITIDKQRTCSFTGHRPHKLPWGYNEADPRCVDMKQRVRNRLVSLIDSGYNTFITGMAIGFDIMCAEIVLELKGGYPDIKLIGAVPCENQYAKWNENEIARYKDVLSRLDDIRCIYKYYVDGCMNERNKYMVDCSSCIIAMHCGGAGGTANTIKYAKESGVKVDNIADDIDKK